MTLQSEKKMKIDRQRKGGKEEGKPHLRIFKGRILFTPTPKRLVHHSITSFFPFYKIPSWTSSSKSRPHAGPLASPRSFPSSNQIESRLRIRICRKTDLLSTHHVSKILISHDKQSHSSRMSSETPSPSPQRMNGLPVRGRGIVMNRQI